MYLSWAAITASALLSSLVAGQSTSLSTQYSSIDTCGEVDAELKLPSLLWPFNTISVGIIKECLCISAIPQYIAENELILGVIALFGKNALIAELTSMVNSCAGHAQCYYPLNSVPSCQSGNPCFFSCTNGYTAYPSGTHPTQCVCSSPHTECNGKCGTFQGCPSTYYAKRDLTGGERCSKGYTACPIPGRGAKSWECIDTQTELESCGGCVYSDLSASLLGLAGTDCTAIPGVSDVSCIDGRCVVRKCVPGYNLGGTYSECIYSGDQDTQVLAYGAEDHQL